MHRSAGVRLERRTRGVCQRHGFSWGQAPGWQPIHAGTVQQLPHLPRYVQRSMPRGVHFVAAVLYQMSMSPATRPEAAFCAPRQTAALGPASWD